MPTIRSLLGCAALAVWLLASTALGQTPAVAEEHPARELIDRAARLVRTVPEASNRDTQAALELLTIRPNPDLEIRARLLYCDHLSERDRAGAEEQIKLARALLPRATRPGLESGIYDCEGTILETAGDNGNAADRFERAVPVQHYGGLGLGLYITRTIVEAHGGVISVESQAGAGATFVVRLPFCAVAVAEPALARPALREEAV